MTSSRRTRGLAIAAVLLLVLTACTAGFGHLKLRIAAGNSGGVYYKLAQPLATAWQADLDIDRPEVLQTQGSPDNVTKVLTGQADIAFVAADVAADSYHAHPGFAALARIHDDYLHVVVRADSDIRSVSQLSGHRIAIGSPQSGVEYIAKWLLQVLGLPDSVSTISRGLDDSVRALLNHEVDAFFWSGGLPTPKLAEPEIRGRLHLLDLADVMPKVQARSQVYSTATIPASTYGQLVPVTTLLVPNYLVVSKSMPDDIAEALVRGLFDARGPLVAANPAALSIDVHPGIETQPIPLHPGALRYYRAQKT
ncbi:TRAP transport system solute receptor [Amycolatopsis mediterranei S699]|uniref:TRAP transport system solute receptor n=2 Tax=Amycolatopsis mediterranei TaxID=33910 RepID=A0A0H3D1K4_AMYMU|nr:TAXI family TRAP transporter solute-binding subunit [Amycolatopsis mediterranei]ADJ44162.1 TRAP transport system solute receptor [Amycolatopsis mediterranei U32]AEK40897.1 TRAP transport system solute receptor [Amycolatopsis mediterranei S699]AFO75874.1 TRAP transport system solute receptor [Amycolatopsis mediterranei S699]AGT83003.1 TRAP transport system solute receptor [Amycolatopsis mediterranei RB]KDO06920.1 C4-dicarboxylate ABC transporter substrate-binding protein [Amycolatopsis medit